MKTTLLYKQADLMMQILALLIPLILYARTMDLEMAGVFYLTEGSVQAISCLINRFQLDAFLRNKTRKGYEITILALGIATLLFFVVKLEKCLFVILVALLYASPFLALWYLVITVCEIRFIKRLAHRRDYM